MEKYKVSLERVPSVNHIYGRSMRKIICKRCGDFAGWAQAGTYLKTEGKEFKEYAVLLIKNKVPLRGITEKLIVEVSAVWPDRRKHDVNNLGKIVLDSIQEAGVVVNDEVCLWQEQDFRYEKGVSRLDITIYKKEQ